MYLVRDINSLIHFHQSTNIFLAKFGVTIILCNDVFEMHFDAPSIFREGLMIQI